VNFGTCAIAVTRRGGQIAKSLGKLAGNERRIPLGTLRLGRNSLEFRVVQPHRISSLSGNSIVNSTVP
jgi:hypothetical protein